MWPHKTLLFLDGEEWRCVRASLEDTLTSENNWAARAAQLPEVLAKLKPAPCNLTTLDKTTTDKMVATAIWFLLFGVQLSDAQASRIAQWGGSHAAGYWVFPRLTHRLLFNKLQKQAKQLRIDTIGIATAHGLREVLEHMHDLCGEYKCPAGAVEMADAYMFAVNFAGVGGTQHGTWATLQFLRRPPAEVLARKIATSPSQAPAMIDLYRQDPAAFIKESLRLDAPVTSATCEFTEETALHFRRGSCAQEGATATVKPGTLHQYTLSIANHDPRKFEDPYAFNPSRANLNDALNWNGCVSGGAAIYPRFCPGHKISMTVMQAIVGLLDELRELPGKGGAGKLSA